MGYEDTLKEIIDIARRAREIAQDNLDAINTTIDYIIDNKIDDSKEIEQTLDILLDCAYLGVGIEEFRRLNGYYSTINKEYSADYARFLAEILEE